MTTKKTAGPGPESETTPGPTASPETPFAKAMRTSMAKAAPQGPVIAPPEPITVEKLLGRVQALEIEKDEELANVTKRLDATTAGIGELKAEVGELKKLVAKIAEQPVFGGPAARRLTKQVQEKALRTEAVSAAENHLAMLDEAIARAQNPAAKSELIRQRAFAAAVIGRP